MADRLVAVVSDIHSGSTLAVCPYRVPLDDGGEYKASKVQRWLWRKWCDYWETIAALGKDYGLPVTVIINGDIVEGDHHETTQIISRNESTQFRLAIETLEPMLDVAKEIFVVRGTESHTGPSSSMEEMIAADIGAEESPDGKASWWHLYIEFGGVTFDVQHHPESGSMRPWTAGAEVNRIAAILTYEYARTGDRPPDIGLRAHKHGFRDSGVTHPVRVFATPSWQFQTAFVNRIGDGGKLPTFGGLWFVCRDGHYTWDWQPYQPKRARPHRVTND